MTAIYSIIDYANLHSDLDFDPEHYHPNRLAAWERISKNANQTVGDYFDEIISISNVNEESEVFDLTDALGCFLASEGERRRLSAKKVARPGNIIASRLRSYLREICIVPKRRINFRPFLSTEFLVFRSKHGNGSWLLPFLLSDDVQTILHWSQTGNNHPRFHATTVLKMPIPNSVLVKKDRLSLLTDEAVKTYENCLKAYPEAEKELLERIEWQRLADKPCELYYIEEFETLIDHGRIDAEHYQPKYKRLCKHLRKIGAKSIGDFSAEPQRGVQPTFCENGDVFVIDSKAVRPQGAEPNKNECTSLEFLEALLSGKARVVCGDVLLNSTGLGTLGRASFYDSDAPAIADNHVAIIKPYPKICLPVYLSLFLNSPAGLAQSEMFQTGSSGQLEIYPQHIKQILVFIPQTKTGKIDLDWQDKLANKVLTAARAKAEARAKLDEAKRLIDEAIKK